MSQVQVPEDFLKFGKPESFHPGQPSALNKLGEKLNLQRFDTPLVEALVLLVVGGLFAIGSVVLFGIYLFNPPQNENPMFVLILGLIALLFALLMLGFGGYKYAYADRAAPAKQATLADFAIYKRGIARLADGKAVYMSWEDVREWQPPMASKHKCITLVNKEGVEMPIPEACVGWAKLIETVSNRVVATQTARTLEKIEQNKRVTFGPFKISRAGITYKEKQLAWDEMTSITIVTGASYSLKVFDGGLLPWANADLVSLPNNQTLLEVIRQLAPKHLLKQ